MTDDIVEKLNSITDEFERAVETKCVELTYDKNKGIITLEESFINLNSIKEELLSAINSEKLVQFPITLQKEIIGALSNIIKYGTEIINGSDSVVNPLKNLSFAGLGARTFTFFPGAWTGSYRPGESCPEFPRPGAPGRKGYTCRPGAADR